MILIKFINATARCEIELAREISGNRWIPNGTVIRIGPAQDERIYPAIPSPLFKVKGKK